MSEDRIHRRYARLQAELQKKRSQLARKSFISTTEQAEHDVVSPRWNNPSFRSRPFNTGEGFVTIAVGDTQLLARKDLPSGYSGVLTGFTQMFPEDDTENSIVNSVTWALRIDGLPINDFSDFVGRFSLPYVPCPVNIPLIGSDTLGSISTSPGGTTGQEVPSIALYATNNFDSPVTLQARLIGYTFPLAEKNDQFFAF